MVAAAAVHRGHPVLPRRHRRVRRGGGQHGDGQAALPDHRATRASPAGARPDTRRRHDHPVLTLRPWSSGRRPAGQRRGPRASRQARARTPRVAVPRSDPARPSTPWAAAERGWCRGDPWRLFWCAGSGVVGLSARPAGRRAGHPRRRSWLARAALAPRRRGRLPRVVRRRRVRRPRGPPFTELTPPGAISPYGVAKLAPRSVRASPATGVPVLIGRIANLYGPGQDLAQGAGTGVAAVPAAPGAPPDLHLRRRWTPPVTTSMSTTSPGSLSGTDRARPGRPGRWA